MPQTELLKIEFPCIGDSPIYAQHYHTLLKIWWDHFGLRGKVLVIGEPGEAGKYVKQVLKKDFPLIEDIYSVDLDGADIVWDITKPLNSERKFDWIIFQATLEHVTDPVAAMVNLGNQLMENGLLYVHSVGPEFPIHRHPLDCYRFLLDALDAFARLANLKWLTITTQVGIGLRSIKSKG